MKNFSSFIKVFRIFSVLLSIPVFSLASDKIEILSDNLMVLRDENKAIFTGNVIAEREKMKVSANEMTAYYEIFDSEGNGNKKTEVKRIVANGKVIIETESETASGQKGEYNMRDDVFILTGDVIMKQGENVMVGDRFIYDRKLGKGIMSSNKEKNSRVKAVLVN